MKKYLLLVVLLFIKIFQSFSQSTPTFNKTYQDTQGTLNVVMVDSFYYSAMVEPINNYQQVVLKKLDKNGNLILEKYYGQSNEYLVSLNLILSNDSALVIGCFNNNIITGSISIFLLKVDLFGDTIWYKNIYAPPGFNYFANYMIETSDNGFLISGEIVDTNYVDGNAFILKTDNLGNEQWHITHGGNNYDNFYSSVQLSDNSFLSLGWTRSYGFGNNNNQDVYLVKTDSSGNFIWQKTFGSTDNEIGIGITATADNNYLIASGRFFFSSSTKKGTIIKIDSSGNVIWQNNYGASFGNAFWWVRERMNGDIVAISAETNGAGDDEGWIVNTDSLGFIKWDRKFPVGMNHAYFRDVKFTTDGGFICAGFAFDTPVGGQAAWLVKLDSLGCDSAGCATYTSLNEIPIVASEGIKVSPNPANNFISLSFPQPMFTACRIRILDLLGKQVYKQTSYVEKTVSLPVSSLPNGIYVVVVFHEGKKEYSKFIKQ